MAARPRRTASSGVIVVRAAAPPAAPSLAATGRDSRSDTTTVALAARPSPSGPRPSFVRAFDGDALHRDRQRTCDVRPHRVEVRSEARRPERDVRVEVLDREPAARELLAHAAEV